MPGYRNRGPRTVVLHREEVGGSGLGQTIRRIDLPVGDRLGAAGGVIAGRTTAAGRVGVDMRECEMSARPPVGRTRNVGLDLVGAGTMSGPHGLMKKGGTKAC